jgi:IPT/TIG domain
MPRPIGQSQRLFSGRHAPPAPIVLSIAPNMGSSAGGTPVTITGANFLTATSAAVGGVNLSAFVVVDDNHITGTTGAHATGAANVTVTSPSGTSAPLVGGFTYVFDPGTLPLNLWQRADYPGPLVVWPGSASAGTSGAHNCPATTTATQGPPLNGRIPALYTNPQSSVADAKCDQYISVPAYSGWMLAKGIVANADGGAATPYLSTQIAADSTNALFGCSYSAGGIDVWALSSFVGYVRLQFPLAVGVYGLLQWYYDNVNLFARLNSGAWASVACVAGFNGIPLNGQAYTIGAAPYSAVPFFDGDVPDHALSPTVISQPNFANVVSYCNARYGLAL